MRTKYKQIIRRASAISSLNCSSKSDESIEISFNLTKKHQKQNNLESLICIEEKMSNNTGLQHEKMKANNKKQNYLVLSLQPNKNSR